jgi:hypothetical protein
MLEWSRRNGVGWRPAYRVWCSRAAAVRRRMDMASAVPLTVARSDSSSVMGQRETALLDNGSRGTSLWQPPAAPRSVGCERSLAWLASMSLRSQAAVVFPSRGEVGREVCVIPRMSGFRVTPSVPFSGLLMQDTCPIAVPSRRPGFEVAVGDSDRRGRVSPPCGAPTFSPCPPTLPMAHRPHAKIQRRTADLPRPLATTHVAPPPLARLVRGEYFTPRRSFLFSILRLQDVVHRLAPGQRLPSPAVQ